LLIRFVENERTLPKQALVMSCCAGSWLAKKIMNKKSTHQKGRKKRRKKKSMQTGLLYCFAL